MQSLLLLQQNTTDNLNKWDGEYKNYGIVFVRRVGAYFFCLLLAQPIAEYPNSLFPLFPQHSLSPLVYGYVPHISNSADQSLRFILHHIGVVLWSRLEQLSEVTQDIRWLQSKVIKDVTQVVWSKE